MTAAIQLLLVLYITATAFGQPTRVSYALVVAKVEPVYPDTAKKKGIEGAVRVDAVIGKDGHVMKVDAISGSTALRDAAKSAVLHWAFRPTLLNGEPIEVITEVCIPFVRSNRTPPPCSAPRRVRR